MSGESESRARRAELDRRLPRPITPTGDAAAREVLVLRILPLERPLARRYHGDREPLDDLGRIASLGLPKAIDRFDPDLSNAFSS